MITSKYFSDNVDFQRSCVPSCSLQDMSQETMNKFDKARKIAGIPFIVNCAYRSVEWDKSKGRSGRSAHCSGHAMDIRCTNDRSRWIIFNALLEAGFTRIGVHKSFIHADDSPTLDPQVIFMY